MASISLKKFKIALPLMSGITLAILFSGCNAPTIKGSVYSCVTSQKNQVCKCGQRYLDYKLGHAKVGEWVNVNSLEIIPLESCPDLVGFSLDHWLTKIKPTLKEGADYSSSLKSSQR